jgi:hypothetical protein
MLLQQRKPGWLTRWHNALSKLAPLDDVCAMLVVGEPLDEHEITDVMCDWYGDVLRGMGNPFAHHPCRRRKIAWAWHMLNRHTSWGTVPRVVSHASLTQHTARAAWLHLLAGNSCVPARHYAYGCLQFDYCHRVCSKCTMQEVANECHVLLRCPVTAAVRQSLGAGVCWRCSTMQQFLYSNPTVWDRLALFVQQALQCYMAIPDVDVDDMPLHQRALLSRQRRLGV